METVLVTSDYLAPFLLLEKSLERIPEEFRMQPNVVFEISFSEYMDFIEYSLGSVDYLATSTRGLKHHLKMYRQENSLDSKKVLFGCFLQDMACAICKEVYYSEAWGKAASKIIHSITEGSFLDQNSIHQIYVNGGPARYVYNMKQRLIHKGYGLCFDKIGYHNQYLWEYACVAYFLGIKSDVFWSYKITNL